MDWFSRYVVSWELSTTLEKEFCLKALDDALKLSKPEIFRPVKGFSLRVLNLQGDLSRRVSG